MHKLDPASLLPFDDGAPPQPPPPSAPTLPWQPPRNGDKVQALTDIAKPADTGPFDMGSFATWLRSAGVVDTTTIALPGATVTLPYGVALVRRFQSILTQIYEEHGYEEYDYPMLVPAETLEPTRQIMPLEGQLLYAGGDDDWASGRKRMVLSPTGESAVYTHWARTVRSRRDLPIRAYRRARYFRPARAGRSVFRAIEALDVFEFQACFADHAGATDGFRDAVTMAREVCHALHVPVLWSTRPPWTNNGAVAEVTVGGDVPLPHGSTIQVGSVYRQGQQFSRIYGVAHRDGREREFTHHVTGALTRRLVLMHLMLGLDSEGSLLVHPDLAPVQVAITLPDTGHEEEAAARRLCAVLRDKGVRCRLHAGIDRRTVGRLHARWQLQGVPLRVYLQPRRRADDRTRAVIVRADTREEAVLLPADVEQLADVLPPALDEVGTGYLRRSRSFVERQCRRADARTVRDVLAEREVAVAPLEPSEEAVTEVAAWGLGEVLGLRRASEIAPCVISGRPTDTVAYISPRR
ncbi:His/Gly/Thr/Pro-type tRNA ligase C-terminal domain-containing protein [Streptomyces cavernae]|uniref:His/Gly/Thr/Pro-type tRNA ligase C-terminal domain-containing protein n=1 Tax=Streptomyces cavernae TaxID=2259034 RepID=UPI000FEC0A18|nr:His/Gly/Thr/Pro-type tRNA ligase C-terminal domain-containing protein [Streptomyces cavernae]